MRPNVYGDQARLHLGADPEAPPIQTANAHVDLNVLSAEDRETLQKISHKLITTRPREAIPASASVDA